MPRPLRTLVAIAGTGLLAACELVVPSSPRPVPDECWFAFGQPLAFQGPTTLGEMGMGPPGGQWDGARIYAWITAEPVDLWGTGQLTRGICAAIEDPAFAREAGSEIIWNAWPVPASE